ncbi:hypothetical protein OH77DRAFT_34810 [Trametes cingulata]|nr:hypothetical protein OH77DRAFT_34810 [Trametes cingulata]
MATRPLEPRHTSLGGASHDIHARLTTRPTLRRLVYTTSDQSNGKLHAYSEPADDGRPESLLSCPRVYFCRLGEPAALQGPSRRPVCLKRLTSQNVLRLQRLPLRRHACHLGSRGAFVPDCPFDPYEPPRFPTSEQLLRPEHGGTPHPKPGREEVCVCLGREGRFAVRGLAPGLASAASSAHVGAAVYDIGSCRDVAPRTRCLWAH